MLISDWSTDVCSSDLRGTRLARRHHGLYTQLQGFQVDDVEQGNIRNAGRQQGMFDDVGIRYAHILDHQEGSRAHDGRHDLPIDRRCRRSEEHTSELQSLMRISYAVFCLKKKKSRTSYTRENT